MEPKLSEKLVEAAAKAPLLFVSASLGEGGEYNRDPGFQLTKEDIVNLRKYEVLGLSLPVTLEDVMVYLDYGQGETGGPGLTARDFQATFKKTYDHARRWSPLREKIMLTGTDLKIFAGSILLAGSGIREIYDDLKASKYLEEHDIKTPEQYLELKRRIPGLPELDLPAGDVPELKLYLDDILAKVRNAHARAASVRDQLDSFGTDLREDVLPQVQLRLRAVSNNTYQQDIKELQNKMDERSKEIDVLTKQYDQMVQEAIKSAAGLNIGGLILAIYTGVQAEAIRKKRNALNEEQRNDNLRMASKNKTLGSLNRVRADLQELNNVTVEADVATRNLMLVWNSLAEYITASKEEADSLTIATELRRFMNHLAKIVLPWEQIKVDSDQLLRVFAEADKEYEAGKIKFTGRMGAFMLNQKVSQEFNIVRLRDFNAEMQDINVTAQMLFERYVYASGPVQTANGLALSASRATADLRIKGQTLIINMERSQRNLRLLKEEVNDPADADDVREDMEAELSAIAKKIQAQSEDLKGINKNLMAAYSRSDSARSIAGLQDERAYAQERKDKLEEQLVELDAEIKSVAEAIDLIAKAGIEKIGEGVALSLSSLKELGLAPPQVQVAMLAIDTLKKLISGIGEAVSFLNMVAAHNKLREKALALKDQVKKYAKDIVEADGKIELLETLDKVDDARWKYVGEFAGLLAYFEELSSSFTQDTSVPVEERVDLAIAGVTQAIRYLKPLTL